MSLPPKPSAKPSAKPLGKPQQKKAPPTSPAPSLARPQQKPLPQKASPSEKPALAERAKPIAGQTPNPASFTPSSKDAKLIASLSGNLALLIESVAIYDNLLAEENALLQNHDAHGVASMLDRKIAATQLYQDRLRAVLADPTCTRSLKEDQRNKVIVLVKEMEEKAKQNALLLQASMEAIEQVIEVVNRAARKMKRQEVGYSSKGEIRETYGPQGASMALNSNI